MDALWKQQTTHRLDPAKYLPLEIVHLIFSFVVYHVVETEPEDPERPGRLTIPSREQILSYRDAPLVLASVSRGWCQIAVHYPLLWSTIIVDRSEDDYLERIQLFLNRSGKLLLDIVLLDPVTPTGRLKDLSIEHAHRFRTLVGHSAETEFDLFAVFPLARLELLDTPSSVVNWSVYTPKNRRISSVPIPKSLHRVQLFQWRFDLDSLVQFTSFPNLTSLSICIELEPKDTQWDKKLWFAQLRHLRLCVCNAGWPNGSTLRSPLIEWLECPALVDLFLVYELIDEPSEEMYPQLEARLLRFTSLRNLWVRLHVRGWAGQGLGASELQNMRPATFQGTLELVHFTYHVPSRAMMDWAGAYTERFFSVFVPTTHLTWEYGQFPSPNIFTNVKTMHIVNWMAGDQSALVAPTAPKLEFPFLEELYLREAEPKLIDLLHAPRLISLHTYGFIPSHLEHISNSTISLICLKSWGDQPGLKEIYLPSVDILQLYIPISLLLHLHLHPSPNIHAITMNIEWDEEIICPPQWTIDYISKMLGTVTVLNLERVGGFEGPSQTIVSFLKPFVYLKSLTLSQSTIDAPVWIDQLAQQIVDPNFLPRLEALSTSEYPSWPHFFQCIQRRQSGFLTGQFQTALKQITITRPVHGALLEHLKESLAGRYIGLIKFPPRRKGSKEWPARPFNCREVDTSGILCCDDCYRAGIETGCTALPSHDASRMLGCDRHIGDWTLSTVFAP